MTMATFRIIAEIPPLRQSSRGVDADWNTLSLLITLLCA